MKTALVFGAGGQAGSYMCELLLKKDYKVFGAVRQEHANKNLEQAVKHVDFELLNLTSVRSEPDVFDAVMSAKPDEVYNFAGKMFAPDSWHLPIEYTEVNGLAVLYMLEAIRRYCPKAKFFCAGSADVFKKDAVSKTEDAVRAPSNPYGCAKLMAETLIDAYRHEYGLYACTGIFFNMESERRPESFFAQKVTRAIVKMAWNKGRNVPVEPLKLGKLSAVRDWGLVTEYVQAAWAMLQCPYPTDFIIATGHSYTCLDFVKETFRQVGVEERLEYDQEDLVSTDLMFAYPAKIKEKLGWKAKSDLVGVVSYLITAAQEELVRVKS
jgi:GDPmannose 4,6-dehydratase